MSEKEVPLYLENSEGKHQVGTAEVSFSTSTGDLSVSATVTDPHLSELLTGSPKQNPLFKTGAFTYGSLVIKDDLSVKVLTAEEWMDDLKRWWNYRVVDNMNTIKLTEEEFLDYMKRHGTEITSQVPDKFKKKSE